MKSSVIYLRGSIPVPIFYVKKTFILSLNIVFFTLLTFLIIAPATIHWFIIPVAICGLIITSDMLGWFRGRYDIFDPKGVVGLIGFYFFFLSPLLWVATNAQMLYVSNPSDWRPWLGGMAIINSFALIAYYIGHHLGYKTGKPSREFWVINWRLFLVVMIFFLIITFLSWLYFYFSMGGLSQIIITAAQTLTSEVYAGKGWIIMIGRSFPMMVLLSVIFLLGLRKRRIWSLAQIGFLLSTFFVLQFLFDGLRGSRSSVILSLFIAAGIIHYFLRPLSRKIVLLGLALALVFSFFYGFYKTAGTEVLDLLRGEVSIQAMAAKTGRNLSVLFLGDLTRAPVQSFLLYRLFEYPDEYDLQWGATYIGDMAILIPKALWPNRPPTKVKGGTELMYGRGSYVPGGFQSTQVYGLAGEAMLNFHIFGVPFAFLLWGFLMGRYRRWITGWRDKDLRFVLAPLFSLLLVSALTGDFDNLIAEYLFHGFVLTIVVVLMARRKLLSRGFLR